jgi:glycosyltransferase involved in cell wall biosynthesis
VARNDALAAARGDIIGFLDADDLWTDRHLSSLLPMLADPALDCARGWTRMTALADPNVELGESYQPILLGAGLYRRSVFDRVGGFDPALRVGQDLDMAARVREAGVSIGVTTEVVLVYRRHDRSAVAKADALKRGQFDAIRNRLRRGGDA